MYVDLSPMELTASFIALVRSHIKKNRREQPFCPPAVLSARTQVMDFKRVHYISLSLISLSRALSL